jgi:hypothetical protein
MTPYFRQPRCSARPSSMFGSRRRKQVQANLESQRRQYELVDVARRRGFTNVEVIDDLGRTASGAVERPGFNRLVAALCAGQVGAVLCLDASRLARNGRGWHHLKIAHWTACRAWTPDCGRKAAHPNAADPTSRSQGPRSERIRSVRSLPDPRCPARHRVHRGARSAAQCAGRRYLRACHAGLIG